MARNRKTAKKQLVDKEQELNQTRQDFQTEQVAHQQTRSEFKEQTSL